MKLKRLLSTLALLAVFAAGCTSQAVQTQPSPEQSVPATMEVSTVTPADITGESTPAPVATSRGDKLAATEPATVNLTTGKPTLLEFFRFT